MKPLMLAALAAFIACDANAGTYNGQFLAGTLRLDLPESFSVSWYDGTSSCNWYAFSDCFWMEVEGHGSGLPIDFEATLTLTKLRPDDWLWFPTEIYTSPSLALYYENGTPLGRGKFGGFSIWGWSGGTLLLKGRLNDNAELDIAAYNLVPEPGHGALLLGGLAALAARPRKRQAAGQLGSL